MSYDPQLLFEKVLACLEESPSKTLEELSRSLHLSARTIQKVVNLASGRSFRILRAEVIVRRVKGLFTTQPELPIKELSCIVGFKSASSFARAIKRASGLCPEELRSSIGLEHRTTKTPEPFVPVRAVGESKHKVKLAQL